jgi:hypothetical protein
VVKGSAYGFAVTGTHADGNYLAYTATGDGASGATGVLQQIAVQGDRAAARAPRPAAA